MSSTGNRRQASIKYCMRCNELFGDHEYMAQTAQDEYWHLRCFVCSHCFRPFNENNEYYQHLGRMYCEKDFRTLFAPCCFRCNNYIIGRFIRAMNRTWHPNCFQCEQCNIPLADLGFLKGGMNDDTALCHNCHTMEKEASKNLHKCYKCRLYIGDGEEPLRIKDETYHSYHFNCHSCGIELKPDARQLNGEIYCLKCHDKLGIPICGACRRPIEQRVVTALGKHWHPDHFVCSRCEKPFLGKRHYEVKGQAFCEHDYYDLFGHRCNTCDRIIKDINVISALDKYYCVNHFCCYLCGSKLLADKTKFYDINSNPCCKNCYKKLPGTLRKRMAEIQKSVRKARKELELKEPKETDSKFFRTWSLRRNKSTKIQ